MNRQDFKESVGLKLMGKMGRGGETAYSREYCE
jgi:hypothetical protein